MKLLLIQVHVHTTGDVLQPFIEIMKRYQSLLFVTTGKKIQINWDFHGIGMEHIDITKHDIIKEINSRTQYSAKLRIIKVLHSYNKELKNVIPGVYNLNLEEYIADLLIDKQALLNMTELFINKHNFNLMAANVLKEYRTKRNRKPIFKIIVDALENKSFTFRNKDYIQIH
jgi:hypothetical protein